MFLATVSFADPHRTTLHLETDFPYTLLDTYKEEFTLKLYDRDYWKIEWRPVSLGTPKSACFLCELVVRDIGRNVEVTRMYCEYVPK